MIKYKKNNIITYEFDKFICDKCGQEYTSNNIDLQETYSINFIGGYSSVFGDGVKVSCDLCQYCLFDMIKNICKYK